MSDTRSFYETNLFWGCFGAASAAVCTVIGMYSTAVLAHLLLAVAWPFATISGWTVCSRVRTSKRALIAIAISLVIGLILWLIDAKVVHGAIPVGSDVLIRWSWFTILLVNTSLLLSVPEVRQLAKRFLAPWEGRMSMAYLIAIIIGSGLASLYLFIVTMGVGTLQGEPPTLHTAQPNRSDGLRYGATILPGDYPDGFILGSVQWKPFYSDVRLTMENTLDVPIEKTDLLVTFDIHIGAATQIGTSVAGVTVTPVQPNEQLITLEGLDEHGQPVHLPVTAGFSGVPTYRVTCPRLSAKEQLRLMFATVAINPPLHGRPPQQLFSKRSPRSLHIDGHYETGAVEGAQRYESKFTYTFEEKDAPSKDSVIPKKEPELKTPQRTQGEQGDPDRMTLHDLFSNDFNNIQQHATGAINIMEASTPAFKVFYSIHYDLGARSKFLSFYVPSADFTLGACSYLAKQTQFVLDHAPQMMVKQKTPGDSGTIDTADTKFSGRVYVYHGTYLSPEDTVALTQLYKDAGLSAIFRSTDYLAVRKLEAKVKMHNK